LAGWKKGPPTEKKTPLNNPSTHLIKHKTGSKERKPVGRGGKKGEIHGEEPRGSIAVALDHEKKSSTSGSDPNILPPPKDRPREVQMSTGALATCQTTSH